MSQGKAGRVPRYVRGTDAASCSALPDPGCSCGSLSAAVVRTRDLNPRPVSAALATSTFRYFFFFFLVFSFFLFFPGLNFPIFWRKSLLLPADVSSPTGDPAGGGLCGADPPRDAGLSLLCLLQL